MARILACDYDGTLIDSFRGSALIVFLKTLFFRHFRPFYFLGELFEVILGIRHKVHKDAKEFVNKAVSLGFDVGIITDRSLFSFLISARRAGLDLSQFSFIHTRKSILDWIVYPYIPDNLVLITTSLFKDEPQALSGFEIYCAIRGVKLEDVVFVGDDIVDEISARRMGFKFFKVDRIRPNFEQINFGQALKTD